MGPFERYDTIPPLQVMAYRLKDTEGQFALVFGALVTCLTTPDIPDSRPVTV